MYTHIYIYIYIYIYVCIYVYICIFGIRLLHEGAYGKVMFLKLVSCKGGLMEKLCP